MLAGHPPIDQGWAGVLAVAPLLLLARDVSCDVPCGRRPVRAGAGWGLVAGLVLFVPLISWLRPFGFLPWLLLAAVQAVSIAAFVAGMAAWGSRSGRVAVAAVWWVALEGLRSAGPFDGFSWGVLGYTQHGGGPVLPVARTLGVLGVSAVCVLVAAALESLVVAVRRRGSVRGPLVWLGGVGVAGGLLGLVGPPLPTERTLDVASVQASGLRGSGAAGVNRLDSGRVVAVAEAMAEATQPLAEDPPELLVWPENSLDADVRVTSNSGVRAAVARALEVVEGAPMLANGFFEGPREGTLLNVVTVIREGLEVEEETAYVKQRPVPFAEYVPFRSVLGDFPPLRQIPRDIVAVPSPLVIDVAGAAIGTVICFENTFPGLVAAQVRAGAEVLVVSTNNTSFGDTAMSDQHLAFTQLRAVETGRWALHAAISGRSAVIDPDGELTQRTDLFDQAIVRATLPLVEGSTPAVTLARFVGPAAIALSAAALAWLLLSGRKGSDG